MTRPRSEIVDRENGGIYHVGGRCVRRAMLFGKDSASGRDFSHRRGWIVNLALQFAEVFTVHVVEYAVMSNHYHLVVLYRPQDRLELGGEDVARRWLRLFPPRDPRAARGQGRRPARRPRPPRRAPRPPRRPVLVHGPPQRDRRPLGQRRGRLHRQVLAGPLRLQGPPQRALRVGVHGLRRPQPRPRRHGRGRRRRRPHRPAGAPEGGRGRTRTPRPAPRPAGRSATAASPAPRRPRPPST